MKTKNTVLGACVMTGMMLLASGSQAAVVGDGSTTTFTRITVENTDRQNTNATGFCEFAKMGNMVMASVEATGMSGSGNYASVWVIRNGSNVGRLDTTLVGEKGDASWSGMFPIADGDTLTLKIRQHNTTASDLGNDPSVYVDLETEASTPGGLSGSVKPGQCVTSF